MDATSGPRVALIHDWLNGMRGGEKCLEVLCQRYPTAPLFTLLHKPGAVVPDIERRPLHTSFLQSLPGVHQYYRYLLPLMPLAASRWRVPNCDVVVSFSHCVAKSAAPPAGVPHVCYCFTPMRYAWHLRDAYFGPSLSLKSRMQGRVLRWLREWDRQTADRVTHFIAISETVRQRIAECYGRDSTVIYPPVDTDFFTLAQGNRDDYYLAVSAFAPYKRLDLAIIACNTLGRRLLIIGTGQDEKKLRGLAGPTVEFLGWQSSTVIRDHFRRCRALLFPGEEDFGIVPVEAQACGTPVIAYGRGGLTETVVPLGKDPNPTGVWFEEQSSESLIAAMETFERWQSAFDPYAARRQATRFNHHRFSDELFAYLDAILDPAVAPAKRAA